MPHPESFFSNYFHIQNWGTFDLQNYGDLLFPLILETELKKRIPETKLTLHSPNGGWFPAQSSRWVNRIHRLEDTGFFSQIANCQGIILGGGDIVRFDDAALAYIYGISETQAAQERAYRIFIEDLGQLASWVPVIWNAVGIPFEFDEQQAITLIEKLQHISYISVRDEFSRKKLLSLGINSQVHVVPDTAFLVARHYPKNTFANVQTALIKTEQFPKSGKVLCFQISEAAALYENKIVSVLKDLLTEEPELQLVLLPIALYTDLPILKSIQKQIGVRTFLVNDNTDLRVVASVIAHSDYFAGSSLHGSITAYAYGIPHLFVDFYNLAKVRGVASLMGNEQQIVTQIGMLAFSLSYLVQQQKDWDRPLAQIIAKIDNHFDYCAELLKKESVGQILPHNAVLKSVEQSNEALRIILREKKSEFKTAQAEQERSQAQLHQTQAELERSQAQLHHTQVELERSQSQLQDTQTELDNSQSQLQHTQVELERSQSQLQDTQTELDNSQSQLQHTQVELERSQSQLQDTQTELDNSQSQLQYTQAELERSQSQLQDTQTELDNSQSQLQYTQAELERSQSQLQDTQTELDNSQSQLQYTQAELERSQSQLQDTQTELDNSQSQLQYTQVELERSQTLISAMESSKFWKLRTVWFWLKELLGLAHNSISLSSQTIELLGINDIREITFKSASKNRQSGYFECLNGSKITKIKLPNLNPITASGWAIIPDEGRPADQVIITYGYKKSLVAVAPVNVERLDVVAASNNPAYKKSGWSITFDGSNVTVGTGMFKAWAYNAERKEATQLNYLNPQVKLKDSVARLKYYYAVLKVKGVRHVLSKSLKKLYQKLDNSQPPLDLLPIASPNDEPYSRWLSKNFPREADLRKMTETVEIFSYKPVISVVMPVYNTPEHFLREAIESVLNQVYPYWELCIADDASTKLSIKTALEEYISKDSRIKVVFRTKNGHISYASNSALEIATGEFVTLLDHDDLLTPDALYEVALLLNKYPDADMIYSDEDKIDGHNQLKEPFFKPDWCPDSFLSRMYTCHLGTYRRSLVNEVGGFRVGFEGSQDYDFVLRFTEKTDKIFHIPKILYHWRIHLQSTSSGAEAKPYAYIAAEKALSEALCRRGEKGRVEGVPEYLGLYSIRYEIEDYKLVSIIIPTKDLGEILDKCLKSIFNKSVYPNYEVIVVDNGSKEEYTSRVISYWKSKESTRFKYCKLDIPFNFSKINNYAVTQAKGEYLLLLNNDIEVVSPDWIDAMVEQAQRPSIGSVGALLLYPDQSVQHAGIVLGIGGVGSHSHKQLHSVFPGYFGQLVTINNYSAVTAACLMCRREVYKRVGGFEEELAVAYNDVDFCLKLIEKGYRNIYLPHVVLYHYESKSRGREDTPEKLARLTKEAEYMQKKWNKIIKNDPCYNPHLTKNNDDYSINI